MSKLSRSILPVLVLLLTPLAANAADMRLKAPPAPPPPPPFSWSGFYIGGDIGGVWAHGTVTDTEFGFSESTSHSGIIGGGVVGFNWQASNLVFGVEGNFDWTSLSVTGPGIVSISCGCTLQASANTDWVATLAARLGIAFDRWLWYVKGGGGWVRNTVTVTDLSSGESLSGSNTNGGWLIGGGIEWAFANNWSAKIEYDYLGLNSFTFDGNGNVGSFLADNFTASRNIQELKFGLNYRFDWGMSNPVTARY